MEERDHRGALLCLAQCPRKLVSPYNLHDFTPCALWLLTRFVQRETAQEMEGRQEVLALLFLCLDARVLPMAAPSMAVSSY